MISVMGHYLCFMIFIIHPIEELHNCNNPNTLSSNAPNFVCDWDDQDFINYPDGKRRLRPKRKADNRIKAHYRNKHHKDRK